MLDRRVDIELVRREHNAAQSATDICADDAENCGCDKAHGLSARHDRSRDQADDKTENDHPDDVQNHDESPLIANDGWIAPAAVTGNLGYRVSVNPNLKLGATVVVSVVADRTPSPRETTHGGQIRDRKDHAGKFRFHLKAPNGEIIAASQGYETKANAEKGIEAVKTHAPGAAVEDHSR
jgi:uncharacterized protein